MLCKRVNRSCEMFPPRLGQSLKNGTLGLMPPDRREADHNRDRLEVESQHHCRQ